MAGALAAFPSISLAYLEERAALLKRVDRKYVMSQETAADLLRFLASRGARALRIDGSDRFAYLSDYYDTPGRELFHAAARGRRRRFKLRSRIYLDSGMHFLELKTKGGRGENIKDRLRLEDVPPIDLDWDDALSWTGSGALPGATARGLTGLVSQPGELESLRQWLAAGLVERGIMRSFPEAQRVIARLMPSSRSSYTRSTLHLPGDSRVTIDQDLVLSSPTGEPRIEVPGIVVETKSTGRISAADRWLWSRGIRPARMSKYCVGVAVANPGFVANRWHRTITKLGV